MANQQPIVIIAGQLQQLASDDTLQVGSAIVDGESLTSTLIGQWNTAYGWGDHDGLYDSAGTAAAEVASHESTYDHTGFFFALAGPTADNQMLQATGAGTADWTTDLEGLTSLQVDNLSLDGNTITAGASSLGLQPNVSISGTSAGDYQLSLSNNVSAGGTAFGIRQSGTIAAGTGSAYAFNMTPTLTPADGQQARIYSLDATVDTDTSNTVTKAAGILAGPITKSGTGTINDAIGLQVYEQTAGTNNYSIFVNGGLSYFGGDVSIAGSLITGSMTWPVPTADNQILQATGASSATWTTAPEGLTSLVVDSLTLDGDTISSPDEIVLTPANKLQVNRRQVIDYGGGTGPGLTIEGGGGVAENTPLKLVDKGYGDGNINVIEFSHGINGSDPATTARIKSHGSLNAVDGSDLILETTSNAGVTWNTDQLKLHHDGKVQVAGVLVVDDYLELTQLQFDDYKIHNDVSNRLYVECERSDGGGMIVDWHARPYGTADGTDVCWHYIWVDSTADYELMRFGYDVSGTNRYKFETLATGSGTHHPMSFEVGGNYNLWLHSSGKVSCGGTSAQTDTTLDVTGPYFGDAYYNQLHLHTTSNSVGMFLGSATTTRGEICQGGYYNASSDYRAQASTVAGIKIYDGVLSFHSDSGLSVDEVFSPNEVMSIDGDGRMSVGNTVVDDYTQLDVRGSYVTGSYANQLHLHTSNNTYGMYAGSWLAEHGFISQGAYYWSSGKLMPRTSNVAAMRFYAGAIEFLSDSGRTAGTHYTPTVRARVDTDGMDVTGDLTVNGISVTENITIGGSDACRVLTEDKTIYLRTDGDDSNGGYASDDAFATPARCIAELFKWVADGYDITIDVGEGNFTNGTTPLNPAYAYGSNVSWQGVAEEHASCAISSISGPTTDGTLEYMTFDVTLPAGYAAAVGDYIIIKTTTSGTNPNLVKGCHKVTAWDSGTRKATVRCYRRQGTTPTPSGAITASTLTVVKSRFSWTSGNGIDTSGAYFLGEWDGIVLEGGGANYGVWAQEGASIRLLDNCGIVDWAVGAYSQNNSSVFADYATISKCRGWGIIANNGGIVSMRYGAIINGCQTGAIKVFNGSSANCYQLEVYAYGSSHGVFAYKGGFVDMSSAVMEGHHASASHALDVLSGGGIDSDSITSDASTIRNTPSGTSGAGAYHTY